MSVGGKVTEVIVRPEKVYLNTVESDGTECAIYVLRDRVSERIGVGDTVWWHNAHAYWTDRARDHVDTRLIKIGYSGVAHPHERIRRILQAPHKPK